MAKHIQTATVRELPPTLFFTANSQDVEAIDRYLGPRLQERFYSYFVWAVDGEYIEVWGMYGFVPYLDREVYRVL